MKKVIAVTMGDPAGIGPEIVVKALNNPQVQSVATILVCGSRQSLEKACHQTKVPLSVLEPPFVQIIEPSDNSLRQADFPTGQVSALCGKAAYAYIQDSINLVVSGRAQAVATSPINKESLRTANIPYIGHTEIFGALTNTPDPLTMFEVHGMRIFFLTRHIPLNQVCSSVTKKRIIDYVVRCTDALRMLGVTDGCMAIAGLNPHSGEHGLFGNEEVDEIVPAVNELHSMGYNVVGPIGADSVFYQALTGKYNSVLSLYHDQGHIAAKTLDFERTISVTCGMPVLRTSVDHGTAFDIAGTNSASEISMIEAILLAAKYADAYTNKGIL